MENTSVPAKVWRLKTKPPGLGQADRRLLITKMLNENFIGTGWGISHPDTDNLTREKSIEYLRSEALPNHNVAIRFIQLTDIGDLVWIVDLDGKYHLGCIDGEYCYKASDINWERELCHRFPCQWTHCNLLSSEVPAGVKNALRQGQAYCRVRNDTAAGYTKALVSGRGLDISDPFKFLELVGDEALEDLVGLYLQMKLNGFLIPSSAKRSNSAYEFVIVSKTGEKQAIVQVKSGASSIDTPLVAETAECYLFAVSRKYPADLEGNEIITHESLMQFAYSNQAILPATITSWMAADYKLTQSM